jgi:hypothetical protein
MVARVIREAVRYAKNNAPKRVSAKNSRKAANEAKKRGTIRRTEEVKPKRKPPVKDVAAKKVPKSKAAKKSLLRKYGVPASIIAGVLTGSTLLNKKDKKSAAKKPAVKKETPMKTRFRAGPTAGSGLGSQRRSGTLRGKNVVANPPKRKNKDTAKKPRRPSRPSMTGFRK